MNQQEELVRGRTLEGRSNNISKNGRRFQETNRTSRNRILIPNDIASKSNIEMRQHNKFKGSTELVVFVWKVVNERFEKNILQLTIVLGLSFVQINEDKSLNKDNWDFLIPVGNCEIQIKITTTSQNDMKHIYEDVEIYQKVFLIGTDPIQRIRKKLFMEIFTNFSATILLSMSIVL